MTETASPPRSAAPPPRPPRPLIPGPVETALLLWRWLRRMSTALLLLFLLAAASLVATVVPQEPVAAAGVAQWRSGAAGPGAGVAAVLDALGIFDVFGSTWFALLTVALFVSLTGCLIPRYRAFLRIARRPPAAGRNLERLTHHTVISTTLAAEEALCVADAALRRRRFRRRLLSAPGDGASQLAGERGHWREGGSLVFHTSFYLLLAGAVVGQVFGFTGQVAVVEHGAFADTRIAYDSVRPGRAFGVEDHRGFVTTLDDFDVSFHDDLTPADFVSTVTVTTGGRPPRTADVRVNHPLRYDGMTLYQMAWGLAAHIVVRAGDVVLFDEPVILGPAATPMGVTAHTGVAKLRVDDPERQIALDLGLLPDAAVTSDGGFDIGPHPDAVRPLLIATLYFGDLGLERPVRATAFDRSGGPLGEPVRLAPGESGELADGNLTVEFVDATYWSGLQVSHQPGRWLLLAGAGLLLAGLIPSLYSYRRRVWVEARPAAEGGTDVTLAGVALHRKAVFADEFDAIAATLRSRLQEHNP